MKKIIQKAVNICKILIWPIIFIIGEILLTTIFTFFFNEGQLKEISIANPHLNTNEQNKILLEYIKTNEYATKLGEYMYQQAPWIMLITALIFIPLFLHQHKKSKTITSKIENKKDYTILIITGITTAISLNIIIYLLNLKWNFTSAYNYSNNNYLIALLATGIMGPIIEELLFRGIVYEKLKTVLKEKHATILSVIIFAIFHNGISQIIYASIIGTLLIKAYKKYGIIGSSILHISANTIITLLMETITKLSLNWIYLILIIIIIPCIMTNYKLFHKKKNEEYK